jgi:hypothetical protein
MKPAAVEPASIQKQALRSGHVFIGKGISEQKNKVSEEGRRVYTTEFSSLGVGLPKWLEGRYAVGKMKS